MSGDHEGRLRKLENCTTKMGRDVAIGKYLAGAVLVAVVGSGVGAIYSAGQATQQVQTLAEGVHEATRLREANGSELDSLRDSTRQDMSEIREGMGGLRATVIANEKAAATRDEGVRGELRGLRQQIRRGQ